MEENLLQMLYTKIKLLISNPSVAVNHPNSENCKDGFFMVKTLS